MKPKRPRKLIYSMVLPGILLILASVIGALYLSSWFVEQTIRSRAQHEIDDTISELNSHLSTIEDLSVARLETALTLLRRQAAPDDRVDWRATNDFQANVNRVQLLSGARASIFQKVGPNFIRRATTIPSSDGRYAVGTLLDPTTPAYAAVSTGQRFHGAVYILGQPYITVYEPLTDKAGNEIIGALFVGFPLTALRSITDAVNRRVILQNGFAALLDDKNAVVACSESVTPARAKELLESGTKDDWIVKSHTFSPWRYKIAAAYPESDVNTLIRSSNIAICIVGFVLLVALTGSQYYVFRNKVSRPILQIHERAMSISNGDLDHPPLAVESDDEISDLKCAINRMEKSLRERSAIEDALTSVRLEVKRDHLTRVFNRIGLEEMLQREHARYLRSQEPYSVLMIDLDHFKKINDTYGHLVGDEVLKAVAKRIAMILRTEDVLGRFGGEEFLVIAPGSTLSDAEAIAERLRATVAISPVVSKVSVTVSIGVSSTETGPCDSTALVRSADEALYEAKRNGRNCVQAAAVNLKMI
jgi:diguanylate cyclase (GGDEF)-like protein